MEWCLIGGACILLGLGAIVLRLRMPSLADVRSVNPGQLLRGCIASMLIVIALALLGLALLGR